MDINEILGAEFGEAESFLINNKKAMVKEFYESYSSFTKPVTGALLRAEMKSSLVFVAASIIAALSLTSGMPVAEIIVNIIRIGSGAIAILSALGALLIEVLNYVKATKDYKTLLQMVEQAKQSPEMMFGPMMFASIIVSGNNEACVVRMDIKEAPFRNYPEVGLVNYTLTNGEVMSLPMDDFMKMALDLEDEILMASYLGSEKDADRLHNLIEEYAVASKSFAHNQDGSKDSLQNDFENRLSELSRQVSFNIDNLSRGK